MQKRYLHSLYLLLVLSLGACTSRLPQIREGHIPFQNLDPTSILQMEIIRHPIDGKAPWQAKLTRANSTSPWMIQSASQDLKDHWGHTTLLNHLLSTLKTLQIKKIHPNKPLAQLTHEGLEPPIDWIKWGDSGIRLGRETSNGRYAYWQNQFYEFDGATLKMLESIQRLTDVRLKKVLPFSEDGFVSLKILEKGKTALDAERQSGGWITKRGKKSIPLGVTFHDLLKHWVYLQTDQFIDDEEEFQRLTKIFSKQKPSYEIIFQSWKGQIFRQEVYLSDQKVYGSTSTRPGMLAELPLAGLGTLQEIMGRKKRW